MKKAFLLIGLLVFAVALGGCIQQGIPTRFSVPCEGCKSADECVAAEEFCKEKGMKADPEITLDITFTSDGLLCNYNCKPVDPCENKIEEELTKFKLALERAIDQDSMQTVSIDFQNCGQDQQKASILLFDDAAVCSRYCGRTMAFCPLLTYYDITRGISVKVCVAIHPDTISDLTACEDKVGYELIDITNEIPEGNYILEKKSTSGPIPAVCAYKES